MNSIKIRIKKSQFLVRILIAIVLLVLYKYFFLPANYQSVFVKYNTDGTFLFLTVLIVSILGGYLLIRRTGRVALGYFGVDCLLLIGYFVVALMYTVAAYTGISVTRSIASYSYLLLVFLYFFLKISFEKYDGFYFFINALTACNIILCVLMLCSALSLNTGGTPVQHFYSVEYGTTYARNGMVRIYSGSGLVMTSFVISAIFLFSEWKGKWAHVANLMLCILQTVYVTQTRMTLVIMLLVIASAILFRETKNKRLKQMFVLILAGVVIVLLVQELNFTTTEVSFVTRLGAIEYFLKRGTSHLFGCGLLTDSDFMYANILHGPALTAYASDVGIIGVFGNLGIIPTVWYFSFIRKILQIKMKHLAKPVMVVYYLASMLTLIPLGYNTMPIIPISMVILEHIYKKQAGKT